MNSNLININLATQTEEYRIRFVFNDNTVQEVDFKPFLARSHHPDIRAYIDPARLRNLDWNTANWYGVTTSFASQS